MTFFCPHGNSKSRHVRATYESRQYSHTASPTSSDAVRGGTVVKGKNSARCQHSVRASQAVGTGRRDCEHTPVVLRAKRHTSWQAGVLANLPTMPSNSSQTHAAATQESASTLQQSALQHSTAHTHSTLQCIQEQQQPDQCAWWMPPVQGKSRTDTWHTRTPRRQVNAVSFGTHTQTGHEQQPPAGSPTDPGAAHPTA
jgi:hypothetical protein